MEIPITKQISQAEEIKESIHIDPNEHLLGVSDSGVLTKTLWSALKRWVHGNIDREYGGAGLNDIVTASGNQVLTNKTINGGLLINCTVKNTGGGTDYDLGEIISDIGSGASRTAESIFMKYGQLSHLSATDIGVNEILETSDPPHDHLVDQIFIENLLSVKLFLISGAMITPADEKLSFELQPVIEDAETEKYALKNISIQNDENDSNYLLVVRYIHSEIAK